MFNTNKKTDDAKLEKKSENIFNNQKVLLYLYYRSGFYEPIVQTLIDWIGLSIG